MKKDARTYVIVAVLAVVLMMSGCQHGTQTEAVKAIDLSMDAEGFWVAHADEVGVSLSDPQLYKGNILSDEIKELMRSKVLKTVTALGSYFDESSEEKCFDEEKQKEILLATDLIKTDEGIYLGLQEFKILSGCLKNPCISSLSLVNCEIYDLEAYNVEQLRLTRCRDMDWDKFNNFNSLTHILIDPGYASDPIELMAEGYHPSSFSILSNHKSLEEITLVVYDEIPGGEFVLTKEDISDYDSIAKFVPFTIEDAKDFLSDSDKRIIVRVDTI